MVANAVCPALKAFYVQDYRFLGAFDCCLANGFQEHKTGIEENTSNVRRDKRELRGRADFVLTAKLGVCDVTGRSLAVIFSIFGVRPWESSTTPPVPAK
jgi:hypothetical protein